MHIRETQTENEENLTNSSSCFCRLIHLWTYATWSNLDVVWIIRQILYVVWGMRRKKIISFTAVSWSIVGKMTSVNLPVNVIGSPASMLISLFFVCENAIQLWFLLGCTNSNFYIDKAFCFKYL